MDWFCGGAALSSLNVGGGGLFGVGRFSFMRWLDLAEQSRSTVGMAGQCRCVESGSWKKGNEPFVGWRGGGMGWGMDDRKKMTPWTCLI